MSKQKLKLGNVKDASVKATADKGLYGPTIGAEGSIGLGGLNLKGGAEVPVDPEGGHGYLLRDALISGSAGVDGLGSIDGNINQEGDWELAAKLKALENATLSGSINQEDAWKIAGELKALHNAKLKGSIDSNGAYTIGGDINNLINDGDTTGIQYGDDGRNRNVKATYNLGNLDMYAGYRQNKVNTADNYVNAGLQYRF